MPRLKWNIRSCRRLPNIWIRTKTAWSPRRKLLNPSTLKIEGVRDCEKAKEKLDRKYLRVDFCRLLRYDYQVCILYFNRKKQGILFSFSSARLSACDVENAFNYIDADHNGKINHLRGGYQGEISGKYPRREVQ